MAALELIRLNRNWNTPYCNGEPVTPADGTDLLHVTRALWIGGAGSVKVILKDGSAVTLAGVPAGTMLNVRAKRVYSTGTTATNIVALW